jgi:hypothetical protein
MAGRIVRSLLQRRHERIQMNLNVDLRQPTKENVGSVEPSHLRTLGLAVDHDGPLVGSGRPQYSYWADCECPDDCLRDHENE